MKFKLKDFYLYIMFFCVFFWDILEDIFPKLAIIILFFLFIFFVFSKKKIKIKKRKYAIAFFVFIAVHGFVNVVIGNDSLILLIIQWGSILFCVFVFDNLTRDIDVEKIISVYWKFAVFTAFIGIVEQVAAVLNLRFLTKVPLLFSYTKFDYRVVGFVKLASICREPSFLGYLLAPAVCLIICYYYSPEYINKDLDIFKKKYQSVLILLAYLFTFSAVAYSGGVVILLFVWYKKKISMKKVILPFLVVAVGVMAYIFIPDIQVRVDDTLRIFGNGNTKSASVNLSSYTYYANSQVVAKTIKNTYGLGSGLGSYQNMFDRYDPLGWGESGLLLNREDANSGLFRIAAELGLIGIIIIALFLVKYYPKGKNKRVAYSIAFLSLIIMYLIRQGNYTHAGSVLFIYLYVKNYEEGKAYLRNKRGERNER